MLQYNLYLIYYISVSILEKESHAVLFHSGIHMNESYPNPSFQEPMRCQQNSPIWPFTTTRSILIYLGSKCVMACLIHSLVFSVKTHDSLQVSSYATFLFFKIYLTAHNSLSS